MSKPKDPFTTEAVQSSKDKEVVLRAARNIVMVSYIMDDGRREPQCSGIIIKQLSDGSGRHRAMVMTHSGVVCVSGRIRDPVPKVQTFPFSDWRLYVVFHSVVPIISSPSTCMNQPPRAYCILGKMFSLDILCYEYKMWHLFVWPSLCKCASIQIFSCFTIV